MELKYSIDATNLVLKKTRVNLGEKNPRSKLTKEKVLKIREMFNTHRAIEIANEFNISLRHAYTIKYGACWNHV